METGNAGQTQPVQVREIDTELSHESQFYIRAMGALPYVLGLKYAQGNACAPDLPDGETEQFCRRLGQFNLEGEIGHAFTERVEVGLFGRLALADDPVYQGSAIRFGIVFRSYVSPYAVVKPYFAVRGFGDYLPSNVVNHKVFDFGLGGEFGVQIDIVRYVGLFAQIGIQFTFLRAFLASPEAAAGLQLRFP